MTAQTAQAAEVVIPSEVSIFSKLTSDPDLLTAMKGVSQIVGTKIVTVKNDQQEASYTEMLIQAKTILREVEKHRKRFVDPLNRCVRAVNDWTKRTFGDVIAGKERELNNALLNYRVKKAEAQAEQQRKLDATQAKMQAEIEKKGVDVEIPNLVAAPVERIVRAQGGGQVQERKEFFLEVTDLKALVDAVSAGTVPIDALVANTTVLGNLAKGGMQIPGVIHGYKTGLTVRGA